MKFERKSAAWAGLVTAAAFAALFAMAVPSAQAQSSDTTAPPTAPTDPNAPPAPASEADSIPQPDWEKVCETLNGKKTCGISRKRLALTGMTLARIVILEQEDKKLLQIYVPPIPAIEPGLKIKIDDGDPTTVKYVYCRSDHCLAAGEIQADFIDKLKKGGTLLVSMLTYEGKAFNFDFSLKGFTATYDSPGLDPQAAAAAEQQRNDLLREALQKKADAAKENLLQQQQQQSQPNTTQ